MCIPCWNSKLTSDCLPRALTPFWNFKSVRVFAPVTATTAVSKNITMTPLKVPTGLKGSEANWNRKARSLTSETLSGWFGKTFCIGTYKDIVFSCALGELQLSAIMKNYHTPSFTTLQWSGHGTYHINYQIPKHQESKNSKDNSTLAGGGICSCQQKTWMRNLNSFTPWKCQMFSPWIPIKANTLSAEARWNRVWHVLHQCEWLSSYEKSKTILDMLVVSKHVTHETSTHSPEVELQGYIYIYRWER